MVGGQDKKKIRVLFNSFKREVILTIGRNMRCLDFNNRRQTRHVAHLDWDSKWKQ